jgi:hypothetical protein
MGNKSIWAVAGTAAAGLLAFGLALPFLAPRAEGDAPAPPQPAAAPAPKPPPADARPAEEAAPKPAPPRRVVLKLWKLPGDPKTEGKGYADLSTVRQLYFDPTGTRLVTVAKQEAHCLDTAAGRILHTFRPDPPSNRPVSFPLSVSPDGRFLAVPHDDQKVLEVYATATGRPVRTHRLDERGRFPFSDGQVAFTPDGDFLLTLVDRDGPLALALATRGGGAETERAVRVANFTARSEYNLAFLPAPRWGALLFRRGFYFDAKTNPSAWFALDLKTGREWPLTALSTCAEAWAGERTARLAPGGAWLLVEGREGMEVCDWRANRLVRAFKGTGLHDADFTPDGRRVLAIWHDYKWVPDPARQIVIDNRPRATTRLKLFDIATGEDLAESLPTDHGFPAAPTAVAVSPDGKTLGVATGRVVGLVDFAGAFDVAPLPALPLPAGPEPWPLLR